MTDTSISLLSQHLVAHLERLVMLREYHRNIDDPYVKSALSFTIDDTQEAIARVSSRLRQLGGITPMRVSEAATEKLLRQSRSRRALADKIKFVYRGLVYQQDWYNTHIKDLVDDPDSQATLVALAEQARVRLERWLNLMDELKVSPDD
jgi:DNA-binding ferritin-like protein